MIDRHVAIVTVGLCALMFAAAVVWQVVHSHDVGPVLAGLTGTTVGALLGSSPGRKRK